MRTTFTRRPVMSVVISIIIVLLGLLALKGMPMALFPSVAPPEVNVTVELAAVETRKVRAVGETRQTAVNARVIAATNRSLEEAVRERAFRSDLYYRLNVIRIELPPLRDRRDDIEPLLEAWLPEACRRAGREVTSIDDGARRWLLQQAWPGNIRELLNLVERAVTLSDGPVITAQMFEGSTNERAHGDPWARAVAERWPLERLELEYVRRILAELGGNKSEAARVLGIDRRTLYAKLSAL